MTTRRRARRERIRENRWRRGMRVWRMTELNWAELRESRHRRHAIYHRAGMDSIGRHVASATGSLVGCPLWKQPDGSWAQHDNLTDEERTLLFEQAERSLIAEGLIDP